MAWDYLNEDDELEDREYPDEPEEDDLWSDDDVYLPCPECGADVYEDAVQCPACGCYVGQAARTELPIRWKITAAVILIAFAIGLLSMLL